jgi:hypothetical protein
VADAEAIGVTKVRESDCLCPDTDALLFRTSGKLNKDLKQKTISR